MDKNKIIEKVKTSTIAHVKVSPSNLNDEYQVVDFTLDGQAFYIIVGLFGKSWRPVYFFHTAEKENTICPFCQKPNDFYEECEAMRRIDYLDYFYEIMKTNKKTRIHLLTSGLISTQEGGN